MSFILFVDPRINVKVKRNTHISHRLFLHERVCSVASMARDSEGGGKELGSLLAAANNEAGVATHAGGTDHETSNGTRQPPSTKRDRDGHGHADEGKALKIAIYGMVNAMMAIPILYGYAAIIFRCVRVALLGVWMLEISTFLASTHD